MRVDLGGVGVEQGDPVYAVAIAKTGVVVVLGEYQVGGGALIRRHHAGRHDRRRVIPTESARGLFNREIAAEAEEKSPRTIARVAQDSDIDIVVRSDRGRGRAVVGNDRAVAITRVPQEHPMLHGESRAVQGEEISAALSCWSSPPRKEWFRRC